MLRGSSLERAQLSWGQMRPMLKVNQFSYDLSMSALGVWEGRPTFLQLVRELTKSFDLTKIKVFAPASGCSHLLPHCRGPGPLAGLDVGGIA